jgi:hypothetical protein
MCFSAEASFGAAAALLPVGAYCVGAAARKDLRYLPLALVPVAFGVQQAAEGCVWLGLHHHDEALKQVGTAVFLFFALSFWPFWIPFSLLLPETRRPVRVFFATAAAFSTVWLVLCLPVALDPGLCQPRDVYHSIDYDINNLPGFQFVPRVVWRVAYLAFICGPLALARPGGSGGGWLRAIGGGVVAGLFLVSYLVYWYAFASVWCFFAAILSLALAVLFVRLPARGQRVPAPAVPEQVGSTL